MPRVVQRREGSGPEEGRVFGRAERWYGARRPHPADGKPFQRWRREQRDEHDPEPKRRQRVADVVHDREGGIEQAVALHGCVDAGEEGDRQPDHIRGSGQDDRRHDPLCDHVGDQPAVGDRVPEIAVQHAVVAAGEVDLQPGDLNRATGEGVDEERLLAAHAQPLAVLQWDRIVQSPSLGEGLDLGSRDARVLSKPRVRAAGRDQQDEVRDQRDPDEDRDRLKHSADEVLGHVLQDTGSHSARVTVGCGTVPAPQPMSPQDQGTYFSIHQSSVFHSASAVVGFPTMLWSFGLRSQTFTWLKNGTSKVFWSEA